MQGLAVFHTRAYVTLTPTFVYRTPSFLLPSTLDHRYLLIYLHFFNLRFSFTHTRMHTHSWSPLVRSNSSHLSFSDRLLIIQIC